MTLQAEQSRMRLYYLQPVDNEIDGRVPIKT